MYEYCIKDKKLNDTEATRLAMRLYNHCIVVGNIAEKVAKEVGLDFEKAYIFGLLHDIGRFNPARFHGIVGYEIAIENNSPELAKICISHVFAKNKKIRENEFPQNDSKIVDMKKTEELLSNIEYDDYDLLIRMCDFMSTGDTLFPSKIEDRLLDIKSRYGGNDKDFLELQNELNGIKNYFDKKLGCNLYELLEIKDCTKLQGR